MTDAIETYMTPQVHCIGIGASLRDAHELMRRYGIRHLPVLEALALVGIVSERDLHLIETLRDVEAREVSVEEAMSEDVLVVAPGTPLSAVCEQMARRKIGSAVVMRDHRIAGIFTTVDALRALAELTAPTPAPRAEHGSVQAAR